jgi:uncharacterized protein YkwD
MRLALCFFLLVAFSAFSQQKLEPSSVNLDTGRGFGGLSNLEADVILEMNKVRTDPAAYAEQYILPRVQKLQDKAYDGLSSKEGTVAVMDCYNALKGTPKVQPLYPDEKLIQLARYHTGKQSKTSETGHDSPGGKTIKKRFKKLVKKGSAVGENISYGEDTGREIVIQLLIDDGVPSRGHRKNIMDKGFTGTGVSYGSH